MTATTNEQQQVAEEAFEQATADVEAELRAEVESADVGGFAADEEERLVHRYLRTRSRIAGEIAHIEEQTEAMLKRLRSRLEGLDKFYAGHAEAYARRKLDGQKARSVKTPFGTVGFRKTQASIQVLDEAVLLALAQAREDMKACVRTKTELSKSGLNEWFAQTGEMIDGMGYTPAGEKFYVK